MKICKRLAAFRVSEHGRHEVSGEERLMLACCMAGTVNVPISCVIPCLCLVTFLMFWADPRRAAPPLSLAHLALLVRTFHRSGGSDYVYRRLSQSIDQLLSCLCVWCSFVRQQPISTCTPHHSTT